MTIYCPAGVPRPSAVTENSAGATLLMLKAPVFGHLVRISTIARWTRTLSTMFAAGVPLVAKLRSVMPVRA